MDAGLRSVFERLGGAIDVLVVAARQPADNRALDLASDHLDRFEVARRGDGEAGLDDVDAKVAKGVSDLELFR